MIDAHRRLRSGHVPLLARCGGFTLIELLVMLALIGGLAVVLVMGATRMLADRSTAPDEVFWGAVAEARKQALQRETEIWLTFDNTDKVFRAVTPEGAQTFPLPPGVDFQLDFLGTAKGQHTIMIAGQVIETSELKGVRFFADGTCSPFRAQLQVAGQPPQVFEVDPWTCAPVLHGEENH